MTEQANIDLCLSPLEMQRLLVAEARRWVGVQEQGGNNRGQLVEIFQRAVDKKSAGEAWCMAFVQSCVAHVDAMARALYSGAWQTTLLKSEHCLSVWTATMPILRLKKPAPGLVVIWQREETSQGHTGIVTAWDGDVRFKAIEGNTSPAAGVRRDGDGVFEKPHSLAPAGPMRLLGFVDPWARI